MLKKEVFINIKKSVYNRIFFLLIILGIIQLLLYFEKKRYISIPSNLVHFIDILVFSIIVIFLMNILLRFTVSKVFHFQEKETEIEQRIFMTKIYSLGLYFLAIAIIMWKMGVSLERIALVIGIVATGLAFAIREILIAFFVWLIILTKNPFRINDIIKIGDGVGKVDRIGTFYVTLKIREGKHPFIKVPNKNFFEKPLLNMGKKMMYEINIPLSKIPQNINIILENLKKSVELLAEDVNLNLESQGMDYMVNLRFTLPFTDEETKTKIIFETSKKLNKIIKKKK